MKDKPENIGDISADNTLKYLGVLVNNKRNCFRIQKGEMFKKVRRMANMMYSVIGKSCSKILIVRHIGKL